MLLVWGISLLGYLLFHLSETKNLCSYRYEQKLISFSSVCSVVAREE